MMKKNISETYRIIKKEKELYLPNSALKPWIITSKDWTIYRWQRHLRWEEHYDNSKNIIGKILFVYHKKMKNIIGQRLGFDVPAHVFDEVLRIHHVGTVSVNKNAKVGKNCDIAGNICLGGKMGEAPALGDNVQIGWGACILGNITISSGCQIGACAVVTHSCTRQRSILCGVPAREIRRQRINEIERT